MDLSRSGALSAHRRVARGADAGRGRKHPAGTCSGAARILWRGDGSSYRPQARGLVSRNTAGRAGLPRPFQSSGRQGCARLQHPAILCRTTLWAWLGGWNRGGRMTLLNETLVSGTTSVSDNVNLKQHLNTPSEAGQTLRGSVEKALHNYFARLEGADVTDVYNLVLSEVEAPLLECVMNYVKGNQTKASELLWLNRGTLRKKLKQYDLL